MTDLTQLSQLFAEIGPALDLNGVVEYGDQGTWAVVVDDETEVWGEWDPDAGYLVFTAELGNPPQADRQGLYETLLIYNHQRQRTGGVRMALADADGPVVQSLDLATDGLTLARLAEVLSGFVEVHRAWREIIKTGPGGADDAKAAVTPAGPLSGDPGLKV